MHVLLLLFSGNLFVLGWEYRNCLKTQCTGNIELGLQNYYSLKAKVSLLSDTWAGKYILFYIMVICFSGELPDIIFGYRNEDPLLSVVIYCSGNCLIWILAAEFHGMVKIHNIIFLVC